MRDSIAEARRQAAGNTAAPGELPIAALRLPPGMAEQLKRVVQARHELLAKRPPTEQALAADLAEAVAIDLAVLANHISGRPRSVDFIRLLLAVEGVFATLMAAIRKGSPANA